MLGLTPEATRNDAGGGTFKNLVDDAGKKLVVLQLVDEPHQLKNRIHMDIKVPDINEAVDAVKAIGGAVLEEMTPSDGRFMVMTDPDGNEFSLVP